MRVYNRPINRGVLRCLFAVFMVSLVLLPCIAMAAEPGISAPAPQPSDLNDTAGLKAFIDAAMQKQMEEDHVAGATIAIVKNGSILYAQGYGYADVENKTPVVAGKTLFRIGSATKLFTGTAVMQLAREGKLDMNADVNTYLKDFKIPNTYPQPITLNNLLTHTAGFEDQGLYGKTIALDQDRLMPLGEQLASQIPARISPPGEVTSYSNYGMALAGYIVEQASGMPYDRYVEQNILAPLAMDNSSASQPLPATLGADVSKGYTYSGGKCRELGFEYVLLSPAGAISATSTDMAHFMIAHLNNGSYGNARILDAATAADMHSRHFSNDPRQYSMCYDFYEEDANGMRAIGHGGDTTAFHSSLILVPSENLGLFISTNTDGGSSLCTDIVAEFFNRYYPESASDQPRPIAGYKERAAECAGTYYLLRSPFSTNEKPFLEVINQAEVTANANGTITLKGLMSPGKTYAEVAPLYFKQLNGTGTLAFREGDNGRIEYMFNAPYSSAARIEWYQALTFHLVLLALCLVAFLSALIAWPARYLLERRKSKGQKIAWGSKPCLAKCTSALVSALNLAIVAGMACIIVNTLNDLNYLSFQVPFAMYVVVAIALASTALTLLAIAFTALAWKDRYWSLPWRIHYTIVTIAMVAFTWLLYYWNMIGFRF